MSFKSAIRKIGRAFAAKDNAMFEDALTELEEEHEKSADEGSEREVEIHNHIPSADTSLGEFPERTRSNDTEEPPWFKAHREANDKRMTDMEGNIANLLKGKEKEEGSEDRRNDDRRDRRNDDRRNDDRRDRRNDDNEEEAERETEYSNEVHGEGGADNEFEEDPDNLEMDRRRNDDRRDRRNDDRRNDDRRDRRNDDEANKEILGELEFEAPPGTNVKDARTARDSRYLEESFQDVVAKAEILAPGIRLPTFDAKASPVRTAKRMFALRRQALDVAYGQAETRRAIDSVMGGRTMDSKRMSHGQARLLFNAAAGAMEQGNNSRATDRSQARDSRQNGPRIQTLADINKVNREKFARA